MKQSCRGNVTHLLQASRGSRGRKKVWLCNAEIVKSFLICVQYAEFLWYPQLAHGCRTSLVFGTCLLRVRTPVHTALRI